MDPRRPHRRHRSAAAAAVSALSLSSTFVISSSAFAFAPRSRLSTFTRPPSSPLPCADASRVAQRSSREAATAVIARLSSPSSLENDGEGASSSSAAAFPPPPTLNGATVFPVRVLTAGLDDHDPVAAVYAVLNSRYKRGSGDGWEHCEYIGVTRDLKRAVRSHTSSQPPSTASHIRALSFAYPQRSAMEELASKWRDQAKDAGGNAAEVAGDDPAWDVSAVRAEEEIADEVQASFQEDDYDDEFDDDDDLDDYLMDVAVEAEKSRVESAAPTSSDVVSPFSSDGAASADLVGVESGDGDSSPTDSLTFNRDNVDKVLDDVRPYLVSDGGNVSVERVDETTGNVYLVLEGACGSCASSTVTMQMGIERVLREKFADVLGEVVQVEEEASTEQPTELTREAVEMEVGRIAPAIIAMGGVVEIVDVDPIVGVVELRFRGSNKVQQGLELAVRDLPLVKHVKFVN